MGGGVVMDVLWDELNKQRTPGGGERKWVDGLKDRYKAS